MPPLAISNQVGKYLFDELSCQFLTAWSLAPTGEKYALRRADLESAVILGIRSVILFVFIPCGRTASSVYSASSKQSVKDRIPQSLIFGFFFEKFVFAN